MHNQNDAVKGRSFPTVLYLVVFTTRDDVCDLCDGRKHLLRRKCRESPVCVRIKWLAFS